MHVRGPHGVYNFVRRFYFLKTTFYGYLVHYFQYFVRSLFKFRGELTYGRVQSKKNRARLPSGEFKRKKREGSPEPGVPIPVTRATRFTIGPWASCAGMPPGHWNAPEPLECPRATGMRPGHWNAPGPMECPGATGMRPGQWNAPGPLECARANGMPPGRRREAPGQALGDFSLARGQSIALTSRLVLPPLAVMDHERAWWARARGVR